MVRTLPLQIAALAIASHASAAPMSAEEFDAYTTGKTLYFREGGVAYGAERYLPGRRVEWSFLDGECKTGEWYPDGPAICFIYEDTPDPQCWIFERTDSGLVADFLGDEGANTTTLYEADKSEDPLYCKGPDVGV